MKLIPATVTRLEKAAMDNGFDLDRGRDGDWLSFASSQAPLQIWLTAAGESSYQVALSRSDVHKALADLGAPSGSAIPSGAAAARVTSGLAALHRVVRRAFQLARTLPDEPLKAFLDRTAGLPRGTEAERLIVQRVGQDLFRERLLDFWEGRCAITGLDVPALLRASHIKPWADCQSDAERLDVHNGLLLAPHLDAAFDLGYITVADDGHVTVADALGSRARALLGLDAPLRVPALGVGHRAYLPWHQEHVFRGKGRAVRGREGRPAPL